MCAIMKKSKTSLKKQRKGHESDKPDRPFEDSVLRRARKIVDNYSIVSKKDDQLGYIGNAIELPMVFADGKTVTQCYEATKEALIVAVATMIECGRKPPMAGASKKRSIQVNIRLTPEEKMLMTNASTERGFRGISDFIRNCALERIHTI
jgi:predicted RNase H-like HicB family nuclease